MPHKANISMNGTLYAWLTEVGRRMGARSVPGTARSILNAVMRASQSAEAAMGMISMIHSIQCVDTDDDSLYIDTMMQELSEANRLDPSQQVHINSRR